ncbi:MAG: tRNA preQ1(34) S-adenosylmethionine ribosyltransferase-isomerase QueA [Chthoniobacterales bacterium]
MSLRLADYDYDLPPDLIARRPLPQRDASRMMILDRRTGQIEHGHFQHLSAHLEPTDLLVLNNTRVVPARRLSDDGKVEFLILEKLGPARWKCLVKPGRKMRVGAETHIGKIAGRVETILPEGERVIRFAADFDVLADGAMPLPPYLRRESDLSDFERYQTTYAEVPGAVAAPTAGLHFTPQLLAGLAHTFVTLHVGLGTFRPVKSENIADHRMHSERFMISAAAAEAINAAHRVVAVGTTSLRVLEAARRTHGKLVAQESITDIFIHPPYQVRYADALLTNFHLPRSTLLMLVSAFAGHAFVREAYAAAIRERYRFFSYGDCMLIL